MNAAANTLAQRLGALVRRERQRLELTQAALAERADVSVQYLSQIERGEANVTVHALERIAAALNWDPAPEAPSAVPPRRGRPTKEGGQS